MTKRTALVLPSTPAINFVKLLVVTDLRIGDVFYGAGQTIEVFYNEAVQLLTDYPDHFEEVIS